MKLSGVKADGYPRALFYNRQRAACPRKINILVFAVAIAYAHGLFVVCRPFGVKLEVYRVVAVAADDERLIPDRNLVLNFDIYVHENSPFHAAVSKKLEAAFCIGIFDSSKNA